MKEVEGEGVCCGGGGLEKEELKEVEGELESERKSEAQESRGRERYKN